VRRNSKGKITQGALIPTVHEREKGAWEEYEVEEKEKIDKGERKSGESKGRANRQGARCKYCKKKYKGACSSEDQTVRGENATDSKWQERKEREQNENHLLTSATSR